MGICMIKISVASLVIGIDNRYDYIEKLARGYITRAEDEADFIVRADDEDFEREERFGDAEHRFPPAYLESIIIHRKIAEQLPKYNAFVFHGAAMSVGDKAYILTAPSGTGKTTHMRLWLDLYDDVSVINGDKPIIRVEEGRAYVYGTPWRGKENYGSNTRAELSAIVFLSRGKENRAESVSADEVSLQFFRQAYMPESREALARTMSLAGDVLRNVERVALWCNMQRSAAEVARSAIEKSVKNKQ